MNPITVTFNIDRNSAILAGNSQHGKVTFVLDPGDLSPEQRKELTMCSTDKEGALDLQHFIYPGPSAGTYMSHDLPKIADDDPAHAVELLDARIRIRAEKDKEVDAERAQKQAERQEALRKFLSKPAEKWVDNTYFLDPKIIFPVPLKATDDELRPGGDGHEHFLAVEAYVERVKAERQEKEKAAKKAAEQEMVSWLKEHGSELLQARHEDGYDWKALANSEWLAVHLEAIGHAEHSIPHEGSWAKDRNRPTLKEMNFAKSLRANLEGRGVTVDMCKVVWLEPWGDDYAYEQDTRPYSPSGQPAVELDVQTPIGHVYRYILIETAG